MWIRLQTNFESLRKSQSFWWTTLLTATLLGFTLTGLLWFWQKLPPVIPLFYSLPWGEEQLASPLSLLLLLSSIIFVYCLNVLTAVVVYPLSAYFSRMLIIGSFFFTILTSIAIWKILLLIA